MEYKILTPKQLMLAAYHGHASLVKLLLDHGADPNRINDRGQSPLAGAVFKGEAEVIEVYLFLHFLLQTYFLLSECASRGSELTQTGTSRRRSRPRSWHAERDAGCHPVQAGGDVEGEV